ncbi:protein phosphatase 1 regulatory subunit 17 [Bombina bombina]|uniref:protein phosphatase 1 regulatory subunit 17 n=1 Tax=Bombina bombina TaxID=8345 RepID=UPI00235A7294|nr:protein phosphatase 1 regulatory subunit 17 [Bombina bombina]
MMSTEFVSPLDISEDRLDKREQHCKLLDNLSEQLMRSCDIQMNSKKGKPIHVSQEMENKQPRRKDTPALHKPPFMPDFSQRLLKNYDSQEMAQKNKHIASSLNEKEMRKPRRKDTPALHIAPLLPETPEVLDILSWQKAVEGGTSMNRTSSSYKLKDSD